MHAWREQRTLCNSEATLLESAARQAPRTIESEALAAGEGLFLYLVTRFGSKTHHIAGFIRIAPPQLC
jgi:hypothetical protein